MPERFDVRYVDSNGDKRYVVMLHRALFGSLERFIGMLLEQHGAALPAWLAPEQICVIPVGEAHREHARSIVDQLAAAGLRARVDASDESLKKRIAIAHHDGVPFQIIVGDREIAGGTIAIRARDAQWWAPVELAIADLAKRCQSTS